MVRPKKDPKLLMAYDLRIPLTHEQKMLVSEAAGKEQSDMASWCRSILVKAAEKALNREEMRERK